MPYKVTHKRGESSIQKVPVAVQKYVKKEINKKEWGPVRTKFIDLDVSYGGGITNYVLDVHIINDMMSSGAIKAFNFDTPVGQFNGNTYRIDYVKLHGRMRLGSSETTSAIDENVRTILFRHEKPLEDFWSATPGEITDDIDGWPYLDNVFNAHIRNVYVDRRWYVQSHAADEDTTVPGQTFIGWRRKMKYTNKVLAPVGLTSWDASTETDKGVTVLALITDDPDGGNGTFYGYIEVGYRCMEI